MTGFFPRAREHCGCWRRRRTRLQQDTGWLRRAGGGGGAAAAARARASRAMEHLEHLECDYQPHMRGRGAKKRTQRAG